MVIQRNWKTSTSDALLQNSSSEDSSGSWQLQSTSKGAPSREPQPTNTMPNRHVINRQVALNTIAVMHRRFSLPGIIQTSGRPPAEFRASANKSLDILRQNIQSAVTKEIDQVIKKYLEKFFVPAVNNIRSNLGEESVGEEQVRAVCRAMLDGARSLYAAPPRPPAASRPAPSPSELSDSESSNGADSRFGRPSSSPSYGKRKESDTDSDAAVGVRRKRRMEGVVCPAHKWDPARLNQETLFIMGSIANKVLGLGQSRGRLYSKHAGLLRYPADSADKEWIANQNLTTPAGGRTYIMVLEDIEELVVSEDYRHSPALRLNELSGFRAPPFMLRKIQAFLTRRGDMSEDYTSSTPTPTPPPGEASTSKAPFIKVEQAEDSSEAPIVIKIEETDDQTSKDFLKEIKVEDKADEQIFQCNFVPQEIKLEKGDDTLMNYQINRNTQQLPSFSGNFTSIVSSGISSIDGNYWKCLNEGQQLSDHSGNSGLKVELNEAAEFIDADIEFLSSDFCSYVDSEADVKKSFDRISDGSGGDFFISDGNTLVTTPQNSAATSSHSVVYNQASPNTFISKPGIVTSVLGSVAVGSAASTIMQSYVTQSSSPIKTFTVASRLPSTATVFSAPNPHPFTQTVTAFQQNASTTHAQIIAQIPHCSSTVTLQQNVLQPATRTVYSLAGTTKTLTPGSTIIGFGSRPTLTGNVINAGNFINISTKNFSTGNILHNAIVSRNMVNRGLNINRCDLSKAGTSNVNPTAKSAVVIPSASTSTYSRISAVSLPSKIDLHDDASITTTKAMIDNTCNSSAMLKKVLTLGSAGVNKTFLSPPTQKLSGPRATSAASSSNLSASHATLSALLSGGSDSSHSDKKNN